MAKDPDSALTELVVGEGSGAGAQAVMQHKTQMTCARNLRRSCAGPLN
jgi:hypothetical protein